MLKLLRNLILQVLFVFHISDDTRCEVFFSDLPQETLKIHYCAAFCTDTIVYNNRCMQDCRTDIEILDPPQSALCTDLLQRQEDVFQILSFEHFVNLILHPKILKQRYRARSKLCHPDKGGSEEWMRILNSQMELLEHFHFIMINEEKKMDVCRWRQPNILFGNLFTHDFADFDALKNHPEQCWDCEGSHGWARCENEYFNITNITSLKTKVTSQMYELAQSKAAKKMSTVSHQHRHYFRTLNAPSNEERSGQLLLLSAKLYFESDVPREIRPKKTIFATKRLRSPILKDLRQKFCSWFNQRMSRRQLSPKTIQEYQGFVKSTCEEYQHPRRVVK